MQGICNWALQFFFSCNYDIHMIFNELYLIMVYIYIYIYIYLYIYAHRPDCECYKINKIYSRKYWTSYTYPKVVEYFLLEFVLLTWIKKTIISMIVRITVNHYFLFSLIIISNLICLKYYLSLFLMIESWIFVHVMNI